MLWILKETIAASKRKLRLLDEFEFIIVDDVDFPLKREQLNSVHRSHGAAE